MNASTCSPLFPPQLKDNDCKWVLSQVRRSICNRGSSKCCCPICCYKGIWRKHDDVIKWKHFRVTGHLCEELWRGALMFSLTCAWINGWVNNGVAGDLRCHHAHYDVTVMCHLGSSKGWCHNCCLKGIWIKVTDNKPHGTYLKVSQVKLTNWGRCTIATILQKTFSNALRWMEMYELYFTESLPNYPMNNIPALVRIMVWRRKYVTRCASNVMVQFDLIDQHLIMLAFVRCWMNCYQHMIPSTCSDVLTSRTKSTQIFVICTLTSTKLNKE